VATSASGFYLCHGRKGRIMKDARTVLDSPNASLFKSLTDSIPALIWMSGPDKKCYFFNRAWLDFTGRTLEQECGHGWAEGVHSEDYDRCMSVYTAAFDKRIPFEMS